MISASHALTWEEVLPAELLKKLNATMTGFESRYQGAIVTCLKFLACLRGGKEHVT